MEGAGLCIGVSTYSDGRLTSCPAAARTAQALALAVAPCLSNGAHAVVDPKRNYELFLAIQTTIQKARGGLFFLYFAGVTLRRGDDLLLTTTSSNLDQKSDGVPWSDIDAILEQERVSRGIVILNSEGFAGIGWGGASQPGIHGMGSVRIHDPLVAEQRIAAYGDAVVDAFRKSAHELRDCLTEGRLDVASLGRYLTARFPAPEREKGARPKRGEAPFHETYGNPEPNGEVVLRDLREELSRKRPPENAALASVAGAMVPRRPSFLPFLLLAALAVAGGVVYWILRR